MIAQASRCPPQRHFCPESRNELGVDPSQNCTYTAIRPRRPGGALSSVAGGRGGAAGGGELLRETGVHRGVVEKRVDSGVLVDGVCGVGPERELDGGDAGVPESFGVTAAGGAAPVDAVARHRRCGLDDRTYQRAIGSLRGPDTPGDVLNGDARAVGGAVTDLREDPGRLHRGGQPDVDFGGSRHGDAVDCLPTRERPEVNRRCLEQFACGVSAHSRGVVVDRLLDDGFDRGVEREAAALEPVPQRLDGVVQAVDGVLAEHRS